jgi:hypothetical protein
MRETGKPTFVVSDHCWRAGLRARGAARGRGSRAVSTHGLNTQRVSAVQKVWLSYVHTTILLQHGPAAHPPPRPMMQAEDKKIESQAFFQFRLPPKRNHTQRMACKSGGSGGGKKGLPS